MAEGARAGKEVEERREEATSSSEAEEEDISGRRYASSMSRKEVRTSRAARRIWETGSRGGEGEEDEVKLRCSREHGDRTEQS